MSSGDLAPALLTISHLTGLQICLPFSNLRLHPVAYTRNLKGYPCHQPVHHPSIQSILFSPPNSIFPLPPISTSLPQFNPSSALPSQYQHGHKLQEDKEVTVYHSHLTQYLAQADAQQILLHEKINV